MDGQANSTPHVHELGTVGRFCFCMSVFAGSCVTERIGEKRAQNYCPLAERREIR